MWLTPNLNLPQEQAGVTWLAAHAALVPDGVIVTVTRIVFV